MAGACQNDGTLFLAMFYSGRFYITGIFFFIFQILGDLIGFFDQHSCHNWTHVMIHIL